MCWLMQAGVHGPNVDGEDTDADECCEASFADSESCYIRPLAT